MREIKFRAYLGDGVWCLAELKGEKFDTRIFPLKEGAVLNLKIDGWQQYTGLKDKNGKGIYEGDVVNGLGEGVHLVEYKTNGFYYGNSLGTPTSSNNN